MTSSFGYDDILCIQAQVLGPWWVRDDGKHVCRGRLADAFVPNIENVNRTLEPVDPEHPDDRFSIRELDTNRRHENQLHIRGLPQQRGSSIWGMQPYKRRPVLFIGLNGIPLEKPHKRNRTAKWQYTRTYTVLPFYSVNGGSTAAWNPDFVKAIQLAMYPQYLWDRIPNEDSEGSILRFDNVVTIGREPSNYKLTKYRLSDDAMALVDEWFYWCQTGQLAFPEEGELRELRDLMLEVAS